MLYLSKSGVVLELKAKSRKLGSVILICALAIVIGMGLRLVLEANHGIIASVLTNLKDVGLAIWNMLCDLAQAIGTFIKFIMSTRSR